MLKAPKDCKIIQGCLMKTTEINDPSVILSIAHRSNSIPCEMKTKGGKAL